MAKQRRTGPSSKDAQLQAAVEARAAVAESLRQRDAARARAARLRAVAAAEEDAARADWQLHAAAAIEHRVATAERELAQQLIDALASIELSEAQRARLLELAAPDA